MGLFDIFTFKKDGKKVFSKEFFKEVLENAREAIIRLAKENIPGVEKKNCVDAIVISRIHDKVTALNIQNKLVLWLIDRLIDVIPTVTQLIYDFLKEKIENL